MNNTTTKYAGNFIYETTGATTALKYFSHAGGYVTVTGSSTFEYVFQYKDQVGNTRLSFTKVGSSAPVIVEENHYYPFGVKHNGYNNAVSSYGSTLANKLKFNFKENEIAMGLNMTEMDFRQYDASIGRFHSVDLLAEATFAMTPYHFGASNPVMYSDPTGLLIKPILGSQIDPVRMSPHNQGGMISWVGNTNFWEEKMNGTGLGMGFGGGDGYGPGRGFSGGYDAITAPIFGPGKLVITHTKRSFSDNYIHGETGTFDSNGSQMLYEATFSYHHTYSFFSNDSIAGVDWGSFASNALNTAGEVNTIFDSAAKYAGTRISTAAAFNKKALAETVKNIKLANLTKHVGRGITFLSAGLAGITYLNSERTAADQARLGGAILIIATATIPVVGPFISIGLGIADSAGEFDGIYNSFNS